MDMVAPAKKAPAGKKTASETYQKVRSYALVYSIALLTAI